MNLIVNENKNELNDINIFDKNIKNNEEEENKEKSDNINNIGKKENINKKNENSKDSNVEEKKDKDKLYKKEGIEKNIIIKKNEELIAISEKKQDDNYKDFKLNNIKLQLAIKTKFKQVEKLLVLKDERILIHGEDSKENSLTCVFDLKNNYNFKLNFGYKKGVHIFDVFDVFQMDDDMIIIGLNLNHEIKVIKINEANFQNILTLEKKFERVFKLSNKKILVFESNVKISIYKYEKGLELEKEVNFNSTKKFSPSFSKMYVVNEKEVVFAGLEKKFLSEKEVICFLDIEKDIIIQSFGHKIYDTFIVSLIKQDLLMIDTGYEYFTINLKNHNKKKIK